MSNKYQVKNEDGELTSPDSDGKYTIQKPTGEFKKYIELDGRWRHVYIVATFYQTRMFEPPEKMVEYKITKNSKTTHTAPRSSFHDDKPKTRRNMQGLS